MRFPAHHTRDAGVAGRGHTLQSLLSGHSGAVEGIGVECAVATEEDKLCGKGIIYLPRKEKKQEGVVSLMRQEGYRQSALEGDFFVQKRILGWRGGSRL